MGSPGPWFTVNEVARAIPVTGDTVRGWLREVRLPVAEHRAAAKSGKASYVSLAGALRLALFGEFTRAGLGSMRVTWAEVGRLVVPGLDAVAAPGARSFVLIIRRADGGTNIDRLVLAEHEQLDARLCALGWPRHVVLIEVSAIIAEVRARLLQRLEARAAARAARRRYPGPPS